MSSSSALTIPVRNGAGELFYLSVGQRVTLSYVLHRIHGHGPSTLRAMAAVLGTTAGVMSKRLDRLAQLGLVGRQSLRGRHGSTRLWLPNPRRVAMRRLARRFGCACANCSGGVRPTSGNVPTSTPSGRFITREGLPGSDRPEGGGASRPNRRDGRLRPPRQLYGSCPQGHRAVMDRTTYSLDRGTVAASWAGYCRRGHLARDSVTYQLPGADRRIRPAHISEVLARWTPR